MPTQGRTDPWNLDKQLYNMKLLRIGRFPMQSSLGFISEMLEINEIGGSHED